MSTSTETKISVDQLYLLQGFADFILNRHLDESVQLQIKLGFEINPPILKYFRHLPENEIYEITKNSIVEYLQALAQNKVQEFIDFSVARWKANQLPILQKDEVVAEDITLITLLRKKQFMHWLPRYTSDRQEMLEIIDEIDVFLTAMETASSTTYVQILKDRISEHATRLEKSGELHKQAQAITQLGNYVWNQQTGEFNWSDEMFRIYELPPDTPLSYETIQTFNDPGDTPIVEAAMKEAFDKLQTFDFHYTIITRSGKSKILHAKGEVTKYASTGASLVIGTVQDVTEKQRLIRDLRQSNMLHRQAESLASMGTWSWDITNNDLKWTDELYRIYGLEPQSQKITIADFLSFVHPDDRAAIESGIDALHQKEQVDYTFRIVTKKGEVKWLRSVAKVHYNKKGNAELVIGTEIDITEKQELIQQLMESERLNKQAQSLANLGNWTFDMKSRKLIWSDEMFRIYQIPIQDHVTLEQWIDYILPEEREAVLKYFEECIEQKKNYDRVHHILLSDGSVKTVHRKGEIIFDEYGNALKMIGTTQDITEQDRIQQELKDNQTFIRKITDATPSIIGSYNVTSGEYVFISEGLEKLLGYDTEEVMIEGISFFEKIIHPDDLPALLEKNQKALEEANADHGNNDLVIEFTYRMRQKNGDYRWFHTYGTIFDRNADGKVEHVLNISLDITEQMDAAEKIKEQEHFIQQIADASPTILYLFDVQKQNIEYINREIFFVLGYTPDEVIDVGDQLTEFLYHPEDYRLLPERNEGNKKFQRADSMIQYECRMKHKDGDWRWLLVREIAFKTNEQGEIVQILGAALDINRRKDMEKTILQNTLQLEQSNASLEEFAYVASHDLKEPLRKISTFGDRLVASHTDKLTDDGKIYLKKIVDASQRMQTMISDLLSVSMISGNHSFEAYSLQKILEESLQTLEFKIEQQNALIKSEQLPTAHIVPSQFRQLFQNLLSNSLKFVHAGRQPVIHIHCEDATDEDIAGRNLKSAGRYYKITIADNGIGFENEFAGKIFAIFQRLHGRSEYEGSGIGLAICKKIVEHHGGVIFAHGVPDEGATFTIILPA